MWIVYLNGKASFWLVGGESYTAGKRDCHIIIKDDASISRTHLRIEVGDITPTNKGQEKQEDGPAQIILTDVSKYGTEVCPSYPCSSAAAAGGGEEEEGINGVRMGKLDLCRDVVNGAADKIKREDDESEVMAKTRSKLVRDRSFNVPCDEPMWQDFFITLGAHGTTLRLRWTTMRAIIDSVAEDQRRHVDASLRRCGVNVVTDFRRADYLVTSSLAPTPVAIAMLCRAVDIVSPAFFEALRDRCKPDVPPPDTREYMPLLDKFWLALLNDKSKVSDSQETQMNEDDDKTTADSLQMSREKGLLLISPPNRLNRQQLFLNIRFVTVQRSLYEKVRFFLSCAQGRVMLDESLQEASNDEYDERVMQPFYAEHYRHAILYDRSERLPLRQFERVMQEELGLCCVEYADVVRSIALARPLALKPFPESPTLPPRVAKRNAREEKAVEEKTTSAAVGQKRTRSRSSPDGRRTDPNPLFGELTSDDESGMVGGLLPDHCHRGEGSRTGVSEGERRVDADGWIHRESVDASDAVDLTVKGPLVLPPYPCFQAYWVRDSGVGQTTGRSTVAVLPGSKCFQKQKLTASSDVVMEPFPCLPARSVLSTTRSIDDVDIIPDTMEDFAVQSGGSRINVFDAMADCAELHGKTAATRRRGAGRRRATRKEPTATEDTNEVTVQHNDAVTAPRGAGTRKGVGGTFVNIFDIDAFF